MDEMSMAGRGGEPSTPSGETVVPARCSGDAAKTVMIGDSYLAASGEITRFLQQYSGQSYRTHYVSGTEMLGGLPPSIPDQFRIALGLGAIETVLMDGGGNDVLIGDASCRTTGPAGPMAGSGCAKTVNDTAAAAAALLQEAAEAGVREVIYFFYPHVTGFGLDLNPTLDYAVPIFADVCSDAALDCTFVDPRAAFEGHPEYLGIDGIHPTTAGSESLAKLIWDVMEDNCAGGVALE